MPRLLVQPRAVAGSGVFATYDLTRFETNHVASTTRAQIFACCMNRACVVCLRQLAATSAPGAQHALVAHCPMCRAPTNVPFEVSVERLRAGAERGDSEAQRMLGDLFKRGDGVPRDEARAVHLFRLAAEQV